MAKTISSMNVRVGGDVSGLAKSFGSGAKTVEGFAARVGDASGSVKGFAAHIPKITGLLGGLGVAMSAASAVGMVKGQLDAVDTVAKLSDRLGIATESIVGLQHAADLAGVSNESLTGGLEKMLKTLGSAATGGKDAAAALAAIGISAAAAAKMTPEAAFTAIAQGITDIQDPALRAKAAMDIFGKSGQSLLPLLMSGSAGIAEAQREAEKLGLTFSRMDAAKVEEANDAMTRLSAAATGFAREAAVVLAPAMEKAANATRALLGAHHELRDAFQNEDAVKQAAGVQGLSEKLATVADDARKAGFAMDGVAKSGDWAGKTAAAQTYVQKLQEQAKVAQQADAAAKKARDDALAVAAVRPWHAGSRWTEVKTKEAMQLPETLHTPKYYDELNQKIAGAMATAKVFADAQADVERAAKAASDAQAAQTKAQADALKQQEERVQALTARLEGLQETARTAGMSDDQRQLFELKQQGASPAQLQQAEQFLAQAKGAEDAAKAVEDQKHAQEDLKREAQSYYASTRTDAEKYAAEIERINELLLQGLLDPETAQRAADAAGKAMKDAAPDGQAVDVQPRFASAVKAGSAEAMALRFASPGVVASRGMKDAGQELQKKQLAESQRQTNALERIASNTEETDTDDVEI